MRAAARLGLLAASAASRSSASAACAGIRGSSSTAAAAAGAAASGGGAGRQWLVLCASFGAGLAATQLYATSSSMAACEAPPAAPGAIAEGPAGRRRKTRVVVLGTGWGAVSFLKHFPASSFGPDGPYELAVVSPRTFFLYTPLLPASATGSIQERSLMEPIRNLVGTQGAFYMAECTAIDPHRRVLTCATDKCPVCVVSEQEAGACAPGSGGKPPCGPRTTFELPYDILLLSVGSVNNTFGIKGVEENCYFLKSAEDARRLRVRISKMVEHASLPSMSPAERDRHLNFCVVGGGPTGVELAAELHDLIQEDVARLQPALKDHVRITVVDTLDHLLGAFDRELAQYTAAHFRREGIQVQLGTMVKGVQPGELAVKQGEQEGRLPFGTCVWATGVAMHPLVRALKEELKRSLVEVQNSRTGVVVDRHLRVKGSRGTIFALGDCAVTHQERALADAEALFAAADANGDGRLSRDEVVIMLRKVKRSYPQLGELAQMLEEGVLERAAHGVWGASAKPGRYSKHLERLREARGIDFEQFKELLADMDTLMRALPPTAQARWGVAAQEGKYLASLLFRSPLAAQPGSPPSPGPGQEPHIAGDSWVPLPEGAQPFEYRHMGSFAYVRDSGNPAVLIILVGMDRAILDLPETFGPFRALKGWLVGLSWRSFEAWRQVSARNRWMVHADWLRTKLFGRNLTEV